MESNKIELLLEHYFQGNTNSAEENQLRDYFSSTNVASHLVQYKSVFEFFGQAKKQKLQQEIHLLRDPRDIKRSIPWLSIAASLLVAVGAVAFAYYNSGNSSQDLGTYKSPQEAFMATQQALALLSTNVNVGIESVQYIQEYEKSKQLIFKQ